MNIAYVAILFSLVTTLECNSVVSNAQNRTSNPSVTPTSKARRVKWKAGSYDGIILGRSTLSDVTAKFGTPSWQGDNEEPFESDDADELLLQYFGDGNRPKMDIVVGKRNGIVKWIGLDLRSEVSASSIIRKFGPKFIETIDRSFCKLAEGDRGKRKNFDRWDYPKFLVYPELGMFFIVDENDKVDQINYSYTCRD